ncbi:MAG: DUF6088 family protein [Legionellaceae bacterium]|nr:DUF6088 family protein [Legionellaceae bacterium]
MTATHKIKEYISTLPEGKPFAISAFREFSSTENIRQILSRLVKSGELQRVARGIFVKPKKLLNIGAQLPSILEIAETLTKSTGETIAIHGAEAARQLQLTTQMPMRLVFYTNGNTRTLKLGARTVKLIHVNPSRLIAPGTIPGLVISALGYLGRTQVTMDTIHIIQQNISEDDFKRLLGLVEHIPAWMSDLFYKYQQEKRV